MSQESHRPGPGGGDGGPGFSVSDGYATELAFVLQAREDGTIGGEQAEATLGGIVASAGPATATAAALHLGDLLSRRGAVEQARAAYARAAGGVGDAAVTAARALDALPPGGA